MPTITLSFDVSDAHQTRLVNALKIAWAEELLTDNGLDDLANVTNAMVLVKAKEKMMELLRKQTLHIEARQAREAAETTQKADQIVLTEI